MKILLADDDLVSRFVLQRELEQLGHECLLAGDGETAWQLVRDHHPDVLVTDWMMPGANGPELCRRVRALHAPRYTYVVLLTSMTDPADQLIGMDAGADDYLTKPLDRFALQRILIAARRVTSLHEELERLRGEQLDAKEQLLSHVSHELRTPLAVIAGFVALLRDGLGGGLSVTQLQYVEILHRNADLLRRMVDDLIATSQAQVGTLSVRPTPGPLQPLLRAVADGMTAAADVKSVHLHVEVTDDLPRVFIDGQRVQQVLTNLLGNALKFTGSGGQVTISAIADKTDPDTVVVSVADTGIGMTAFEVDHVFDRLYQGAQPVESSRKGLGLGLYLCRELVEAHGGRIWMESNVGTGSTVRFTLRTAVDPVSDHENHLRTAQRSAAWTAS